MNFDPRTSRLERKTPSPVYILFQHTYGESVTLIIVTTESCNVCLDVFLPTGGIFSFLNFHICPPKLSILFSMYFYYLCSMNSLFPYIWKQAGRLCMCTVHRSRDSGLARDYLWYRLKDSRVKLRRIREIRGFLSWPGAKLHRKSLDSSEPVTYMRSHKVKPDLQRSFFSFGRLQLLIGAEAGVVNSHVQHQ